MRNIFPLFQSHLDAAHAYWSRIIQKGDTVIDATCGNGYDTLQLCKLTLGIENGDLQGKVYAIDNQAAAIASTTCRLNNHLQPELRAGVELLHQSHALFPYYIRPQTIKLIVYNLGYLPKGDKGHTTLTDSTLQSLSHAQNLLVPGGVISLTCYPGHSEGEREKKAIIEYLSKQPPLVWSCCHHEWINRSYAPTLIIIQKNL